MITTNTDEKELTYRFRGKTFPAAPSTIKQLNYALALNHSSERYERVTKPKSK